MCYMFLGGHVEEETSRLLKNVRNSLAVPFFLSSLNIVPAIHRKSSSLVYPQE